MENSQIEAALDDALDSFRRPPSTPETGLSVDEPALLQLRKACRLLEAAEFLDAEDGYYTLVIEASFGVIERTIQFYLLEQEVVDESDLLHHELVYERGEQAGLYDDEFKEKLLDLWRNNRSRTYYREGIGSQHNATEMLRLARTLHDHVLHLAGRQHACVCRE